MRCTRYKGYRITVKLCDNGRFKARVGLTNYVDSRTIVNRDVSTHVLINTLWGSTDEEAFDVARTWVDAGLEEQTL